MFATSTDLCISAPAKPVKARAVRAGAQSRALINQAYVWQVVVDASGDFLGRYFRLKDLIASARMGNWPAGIVFQHRKTGEKRVCENGEVVKMTRRVYRLVLDGECIYTSTRKRVPKAVLSRYCPEIAGESDARENGTDWLETLSDKPVERGGKRLEWKEDTQ